jgi:SAM-dependent methyltransferase
MASTDTAFAGSIPEIYERYLVPLIFDSYAQDSAARVASLAPQHVLETAAGTGIVTEHLVARLAHNAHIVATDLNPSMLDRAALRLKDPRLEWCQADAMALPFDDEAFDLVACQFGAMFFPDKIKGFKEARRVLKRGGRFVFAVWGRLSANEFADTITRAMDELFPTDPPRFLARIPHGYHDVNLIRADLRGAGFSTVQIEAIEHRSKAPSCQDPAIAYCQGTPLRSEIETRDPGGLQRPTTHAAAALFKRFGEGPVDGRVRAYIVTALR